MGRRKVEVALVFVALAATLLLAIPLALYYAWAASWLWLWFVVPVFNVPVLTVWQLWGIALFLSVIRPGVNVKKDERGVDWNRLTVALLAPLLTVGIGWVVKHNFI